LAESAERVEKVAERPLLRVPHPAVPSAGGLVLTGTAGRLAALQRTAGNGAVARLIQRHPPDAELVPDVPEVNAEIQNPSSADLTDGKEGAGEGSHAGGPVADSSKPAPSVPEKGRTLKLPYGEKVLTDTFGSVAKKKIVRGNIIVKNGEAEILAAYDEVNKGRNNKLTGKAWVDGDAKKTFKDRGLRLNGFADADKVWVDLETTDPTTTVHEMLHINTAAGFRAAVGEIVNEGMTERLAIKAMVAAGDSVTGSEATYTKERAFVDKLLTLVPEATAIHAYFNGADKLIDAYESVGGKGSWATLLAELVKNDYTKAEAEFQKAKTRTVELDAFNDAVTKVGTGAPK
jgi:hypothetical protein